MQVDSGAMKLKSLNWDSPSQGRSLAALALGTGGVTASGAAAVVARQRKQSAQVPDAGSAFCARVSRRVPRHTLEFPPLEPQQARSSSMQEFVDFVQNDMESFWSWCPTPQDGLHRCGLLVKLFDYCGLTRAECKVAFRVRRLDEELRSLGVFATDGIEAHQRVPYDAFVQCRRLREAIVKCSNARLAWEHRRNDGAQGLSPSPLAAWVLTIITSVGGNVPDAPHVAPEPRVSPSPASRVSPSRQMAAEVKQPLVA